MYTIRQKFLSVHKFANDFFVFNPRFLVPSSEQKLLIKSLGLMVNLMQKAKVSCSIFPLQVYTIGAGCLAHTLIAAGSKQL